MIRCQWTFCGGDRQRPLKPYTHTHTTHTHTHARTHTYTHTAHTHAHAHGRAHTRIHARMRTVARTHTHTHTLTHAHGRTHADNSVFETCASVIQRNLRQWASCLMRSHTPEFVSGVVVCVFCKVKKTIPSPLPHVCTHTLTQIHIDTLTAHYLKLVQTELGTCSFSTWAACLIGSHMLFLGTTVLLHCSVKACIYSVCFILQYNIALGYMGRLELVWICAVQILFWLIDSFVR